MAIRFDTTRMEKAQTTPEGWVRDEPILTRTGIFTYVRADGTTVKEYRPAEEVFHEDSLRSIHGVPVTVDHPRIMRHDTPAEVVGSSLSPGRQDGENVRGEIIIHRPHKMGDRKDISLGYTLEIDETPGVFNGEHYDAVQRKIRVNHIAIVKSGRAGVSRLRLDSAGDQLPDDHQPKQETSNMNLVTVRCDGIEYQVPPQIAKQMERLEADRDSQKSRADKAEGERDSMKAEADTAKASVEQARADAMSSARNRLSLEEQAKKAGVEIKADASDRTIREAVIRKVRGDSFTLDGKSDDYIIAAFDMAVADGSRSDSNAGSQNKSAAPSTTGSPAPKASLSAAEARRKMINS